MPKGKKRTEDTEDVATSVAVTTAANPFVAMLKEWIPGTRFTDAEEQAIIGLLAITDGNTHRASRMLDGHITGTALWNVKHRNVVAFEEVRGRWKRSYGLKLHDIADVLLDKVGQAVEEQEISVRDGMVSIGIAIDKAAMLAGEGSTINVNHTHKVDPASVALVADRLREIMGGRPRGEVLEAEFTLVEDE
jgi:hypothetical protein